MPPWIARLAGARAFARGDHRAVFARFVEVLAARFRAGGHPRVREV